MRTLIILLSFLAIWPAAPAYQQTGSLRTAGIDTIRFIAKTCSHTGVSANGSKPVSITFSEALDPKTAETIIVSAGGSDKEPIYGKFETLKGKYKLSNVDKTVSFFPSRRFKAGMLISVTIPESLKNVTGEAFLNGKDKFSFIVDNGVNYGHTEHLIKPLKVVGNHTIPLIVSVPNNKAKHPVLVFVHGGGWNGGTLTKSIASLPVGYSANYLADKLGVAIVGVAYRCRGSNGNFAQAMDDVRDAVKFVKDHAAEYNFDLDRLGIGGESAGSPLSALVAQQDPTIKYYIGWNGLYDFVNDSGGKFGQGNSYGQETPSAADNSAIFSIRTDPPQTLLLHGNNDATISYQQSVRFHDAILAAGGRSDLRIYDGQPHWTFYAPGGKYELSTLYEVKEFLLRVINQYK